MHVEVRLEWYARTAEEKMRDHYQVIKKGRQTLFPRTAINASSVETQATELAARLREREIKSASIIHGPSISKTAREKFGNSLLVALQQEGILVNGVHCEGHS